MTVLAAGFNASHALREGKGSVEPLRLRSRDLAVAPARKKKQPHTAVHESAPRHNTSTHKHMHSFIHSFRERR